MHSMLEHGYGTYYFIDNSVYKGEWKNDKFDGQGEEVYADGTSYVGEYQRGKKNG